MKAAFLVGPRMLEVQETPEPDLLADGLVVRVRACGVCGSDLRRWREGPGAAQVPGTCMRVVPGHEFSATVEAVGKDVDGWRVGDRLAVAPDVHCGVCFYCQRGLYNLCDELRMIGITPGWYGGLAERVALSGRVLRDGIVHRLPDGASDTDGALAEPLSSVVACHESLGTSLADTVVVIGAGPVGCMHLAVARARGARTIVSQRSEPRRLLASRFLPDVIIDPTQEDLATAVRTATHGRGAEIVICANPVAETQTQAVNCVRKGGTVVLFGGLPKAQPMASYDANRIHYGEIKVVGAFSYHPTMHELALDVLARKLVRAEDLVTRTFALDDVQAAFEYADRGDGLKALVRSD